MPKAAPVAEAPPVAVVEEKKPDEKKPKKKMMMVEDTFQQDEVVDLGKPADQVQEVQVVSSNVKGKKAQAVSSAPPKKKVEEPIVELQVETHSSPPVAPLALETETLSVTNIDKAPSLSKVDTPQSIVSFTQIE